MLQDMVKHHLWCVLVTWDALAVQIGETYNLGSLIIKAWHIASDRDVFFIGTKEIHYQKLGFHCRSLRNEKLSFFKDK